MASFIYHAERTIYKDGKPFISIHAHEPYDPSEVDYFAREIARKVFNCDYDLPSDYKGDRRAGA